MSDLPHLRAPVSHTAGMGWWSAVEGWFAQWAGWLMLAGYVLEVCGLGVAAYGLLSTWRDNRTEGQHFLEGAPRLLRLWQRLTRQPGGVRGAIHVSAPSARASAVMGVPHVVIGGRTVEQRLDDVERDLRQALDVARDAHRRVDGEALERRDNIEALEGRVTAVEQASLAFTRRAIVEGVPIAIGGLWLALLGLVLQALATWGSWGAS